MFNRRLLHSRRAQFALVLVVGTVIALITGAAVSGQDKYTVKVAGWAPVV